MPVWCNTCKHWHGVCECGHRDVEHLDRIGQCWPRKDYDPNEPVSPQVETCDCVKFKPKSAALDATEKIELIQSELIRPVDDEEAQYYGIQCATDYAQAYLARIEQILEGKDPANYKNDVKEPS